MIAADVIREVSEDLNDQEPGHEYTRWPRELLQSWLREALGAVSDSLRDLFIKEIVVRVQPGNGWQEACDCTTILRIVGEATAEGELTRYLSRSVDMERNTWAGEIERCPTRPIDYKMTGYTVSSTDDKKFRVYPPVRPGMNKYVLVECYERPDGSIKGDVPDEAVAIVKQWMLYRALSVDSENNPAIIQLASDHKDTYFKLLQLAITRREMEERYGSDLRAVQNTSSD